MVAAPARSLLLALIVAGAATGCQSQPAPPDDLPTDEEQDDASPDEPLPAQEGDGVLSLGYVLPESGPFADIGESQIAAIELAVADLNAAGGVLGNPVVLHGADETEDPAHAAVAAQNLIGDGVNAVIGSSTTAGSLAVAQATSPAGVVQCSASSTSPAFSTGDFNGLFFRTVASAGLQGAALAQMVAEDGHLRPAILATADAYGRGVLEAAEAAMGATGQELATARTLAPDDDIQEAVNDVIDSAADAVIIIAFDEAARILDGLATAGLSPPNFPTYGTEGLRSDELAGQVDPGDPSILDGLRGTAPQFEADPDFLERFRDETGRDDAPFAAQAYDCAIIIGLAAQLAGIDAGQDLAERILDVTSAGEACHEPAACLELIASGDDIAYQARSGIVLAETATGNGEPDAVQVEVWEIDASGAVRSIDHRTISR